MFSLRRRLMAVGMGLAYTGFIFMVAPTLFRGALFDSPFRILLPETLSTFGAVLAAAGVLASVGVYLRIFDRSSDYPSRVMPLELIDVIKKLEDQLSEIKELQKLQSPQSQILDDASKEAILALVAKAGTEAIVELTQKELFKKTLEQEAGNIRYSEISGDFNKSISEYKVQLLDWRRNANVNLFIGLGCALLGLVVMWYIIGIATASLGVAESFNWSDVYKFAARFSLVILIESIAFFFLKLYREDRSMIRYLRNEVTNLESKSVALKSALAFGKPEVLAKLLTSLMATERNFVLKKDERVLSDILYENSDILFEKLALQPRNPSKQGKTETPGDSAKKAGL